MSLLALASTRRRGLEPPTTGSTVRNDGATFDCYAPKEATGARNVVDRIAQKVGNRQAERIVLNLDDSRLGLPEIEKVLVENPIADLKEILVVRGGAVTRLFPR